MHITELTSHGVTRGNGERAFESLRPILARGEVDLELDGSRLLSRSFLDGLAVKLIESGRISRVTFVTRDPTTLRKLGRIAADRGTQLFHRLTFSSDREPVVKVQATEPEAQFEINKPNGLGRET